uniref:Uncharacterized protein n=1 Tax=Globisporangium ultimum (strain ATCC 200006 / CBS 805.95 / DAOM BR144) TaxID=431595 RepID=K3W958_GLOUD
MFAKKLVLIAATAAMAFASISASQESTVHVRMHSSEKAVCSNGQSPMSVEGVEGVFCVSGQSCVANIKGACPGAQSGLPYGAYCDYVKTGVYGCKPSPPPTTCSGANTSPMSVEGVEGIFCVTGQACVANIANGACPGPQAGLPNGAECGIVKTGVYGCKPKSAHKKHHKKHHGKDACSNGQSPMSVEGVEGVFCVSGQSCVANIKGACPGAQSGLPYGAYCDYVKTGTGVYGCQPNAHYEADYQTTNSEDSYDSYDSDDSGECGEGESPMSVEGVEGVFCVTGQACVADIDGACPGPQEGLPNGASCGIVKTGVYGCQPNAHYEADYQTTNSEDSYDSYDSDDSGECGEGESPMSVEGVEGVFCVTGQACVADIDGACPGPQEGLPNGASCGIVKTGVYGCQPNAHYEADYQTTNSEDSYDSYDSDDSGECGEGESPMSVEGVEGVFCVTGQACVANIKDGACPGVSDDLPYGAECGIVKTGVYGCKPKAAPYKKHHKKSNVRRL